MAVNRAQSPAVRFSLIILGIFVDRIVPIPVALTREKLGTFGMTDLWAHAIVSSPFFAANFIATIYIPYMLTIWAFQNLIE